MIDYSLSSFIVRVFFVFKAKFILLHPVRDSYMLNVDYEGIPLKELTDSSMLNWVHHTQHILPQGRCQWFNPSQKPEDDFEEEEYDEDEDGESSNNILPETGPTLLSSVADDIGIILQKLFFP